MPTDASSSRYPTLDDWWDKLVVSLELADLTDPNTRTRLDNAAAAANNQGLHAAAGWRYATALRLLSPAVEIWSRLEHAAGEITARNARGAVYRKLGDYPAAMDDHRAALFRAQEIGQTSGEIAARSHLGAAHAEQGDLDRAETLLNEALALSTEAVDNWGTGHAQGFLGRVSEAQKNWEAALKAYGAALELWYELRAAVYLIEATAGLARVALAQAYTADAFGLAERVLHHLAEHGPDHMDEPLRAYLTVYRVLTIMQQPDNARDILGVAYRLLEQQAEGLSPEQREMFFNNVAVNRAIVEAWSGG